LRELERRRNVKSVGVVEVIVAGGGTVIVVVVTGLAGRRLERSQEWVCRPGCNKRKRFG
jgi:hypothetical protein